MGGYTGSILRVNLSERTLSVIDTARYEQWIGGHGLGSAIFFDLLKDKTIDGFSPSNVLTIMTSPLSGTLVPCASGRTEVQGIGVQSHPIGWFTRSNFGGRFSSMLKYAGWDGIVIEGKASEPVWLDIRNADAALRNCSDLSLWGQDTHTCQTAIWNYVMQDGSYGRWLYPATSVDMPTTQRPAVLAIGPAGENLSRMACLIHDAGNASGQGGFGAVWGSKNLKAVSVIGTGSIAVSNPAVLLKTRLSQKNGYAFDLDSTDLTGDITTGFDCPPVPAVTWERPELHGPQACTGCHSGCRGRYAGGFGNEASCITTRFYNDAADPEVQYRAVDLLNKYGLNAFEMTPGLQYLKTLNALGILGAGARIDCPLDFHSYGSFEFVEQLIQMISYRTDGFGDQLAEGFFRAAGEFGLLEGNYGLQSGMLPFSCWGIPDHEDYRAHLEWAYGSVLGDRDINEHCYDIVHQSSTRASRLGIPVELSAEEAVRIITDKMVPYNGDRRMLDYSSGNMYSEHIAKMVAWSLHYSRFWKQSVLFCDWRWPDFINARRQDYVGSSGEAECAFFEAVTGKALDFAEGIELGRKIWNLDHAVWTLQGRTRNMVQFADYIYSLPSPNEYILPGIQNGEWVYLNAAGRNIDRSDFEDFKTRFYRLEGWDTDTGYPTRSTLEALGLSYVADELEENGTLGKE